MIPKGNLTFSYDEAQDILTIEGIRYSGNFFRELSSEGLPLGMSFKIVERGDGVVVVQRVWEAL